MHELKSWCNLSAQGSPRHQMWEMIKKAGLGLITSEESPDVDIKDVTKDDAEKVINKCPYQVIIRSKLRALL